MTTVERPLDMIALAAVRTVGQFRFDPDTYLDLMAEEVSAYKRLQAEVLQRPVASARFGFSS